MSPGVEGEHIDDAGKDLRDLTSDIEFQIKEAMGIWVIWDILGILVVFD